MIWSLIKISKIPSDSPENFLLCNYCENIMPLLQTIIETQHFPFLKIVKFCTLSNRSIKYSTSGKMMSIIRPFIAVHREIFFLKMLMIYPNCKIYFHKWCQFNLQEISFLIIYIFLYLIFVSTFNEDTNPGMLSCNNTKIGFHEDNLVKKFAQKILNFSPSYPFLSHYCYRTSGKKLLPVENSKIKYLLKITSGTGVPGLN